MIRAIPLVFALVFGPAAGAQEIVIDVNSSISAPGGAVLKGLDRINGIFEEFEVAPGEKLSYERLEIELIECRYPEGQTNTEAFAHLRIRDQREELASFVGWMFASSPALSALDHPRYDVWVVRCIT